MVAINELQQMLDQLQNDLTHAEQAVEIAVHRRDGLRQAVEGLSTLVSTNGSLRTAGVPEKPNRKIVRRRIGKTPTGKAAISKVFHDNPRTVYSMSQMLDALRKLGWTPDSDNPEAVLRVHVRRLMNEDREIKRVGHGDYAYMPAPQVVDPTKGSG